MNISVPIPNDLRALNRALFEKAKAWWLVSQICQIAVFVFGLTSIFFDLIPDLSSLIVAALSILSEVLIWQSNRIKGMAEALLRNLDFQESLGWKVSEREISDLLINAPNSIKKKLSSFNIESVYFASKEAKSSRKVAQNTQESAWWSKHLSAKSGKLFLIVSLFILVISISGLLVSINTIKNLNILSNIGKLMTSFILLIFSLGLFKTTIEYYEFSAKAEKIENKADQLLSQQNIEEIQLIKLLYEYQIARATAPLIPTFIWKSMRNELDSLWKKYRQST